MLCLHRIPQQARGGYGSHQGIKKATVTTKYSHPLAKLTRWYQLDHGHPWEKCTKRGPRRKRGCFDRVRGLQRCFSAFRARVCVAWSLSVETAASVLRWTAMCACMGAAGSAASKAWPPVCVADGSRKSQALSIMRRRHCHTCHPPGGSFLLWILLPVPLPRHHVRLLLLAV